MSVTEERVAGASTEPASIAGERGIAAVARRFSLQARVQNALALAVVVLVGGAFLAWYYAGLADARAEAKRTAKPERVQGEMVLPPLGPAPKPPAPVTTALVEADSAEANALLAAAAGEADPAGRIEAAGPAAGAVAPPVDAARQRRLEAPVLVRGAGSYAAPAEVSEPGDVGPVNPEGRAGNGVAGGTELAERLRPTVLAAAVAGVLPDRQFLLSKGAFIDCTLETAIDSTLPGMTTCVTATDVWSADGSVVLLERGTRLVGETRGGVQQGQERLFVLWSEARTPQGVVVQLDSPGTDALGRSGVTGAVDTHFAARFGAAILVSLIDAAAAAVVAAQNDGGDSVIVSSQGAQDVMGDVLDSTIHIPPTLRVAQGARVSVLVARDVDFARVYALARR